jgi:hypothetical protein
MTTARSDRHRELSAFLSSRNDIELAVLVDGGRSNAVGVRLEALAAAPSSLMLFCEYIPRPLPDWLRENPLGKAAMRLVNWLVTDVCGIPMPIAGGPVARNEYVLRCAAGQIPEDVSPVVASILTRHARAAARMNAFYWKLFGGDIHAEYPGG